MATPDLIASAEGLLGRQPFIQFIRGVVVAFVMLTSASPVCRAGVISEIPLNHQVILRLSESTWTPSLQQVKESLPVIQAYLEKSTEARSVTAVVGVGLKSRRDWIATSIKGILTNEGGYRVQFWGIDYKGSKVIYCNFFPAPPKASSDSQNGFGYWRKDKVEVDDGGYSFFQVTYDPKLKAVVLFDCNGVAFNPAQLPSHGIGLVAVY